MENGEHRMSDLVTELVQHLMCSSAQPNNPQNPSTSSATHQPNTLQPHLAFPSDESAMVESIKRRLATAGKSSEALTFADIYAKFSLKSGPGSVKNKWVVIYLLKTISEDRKARKNQLPDGISNAFMNFAVAGGLPTLNENMNALTKNMNTLKGLGNGSRGVRAREFSSPCIMGTPGIYLISLGLVYADKIPRFMATLTSPIEGYIEKINEATKKSAAKEKLR